jgi:hypothetical protein
MKIFFYNSMGWNTPSFPMGQFFRPIQKAALDSKYSIKICSDSLLIFLFVFRHVYCAGDLAMFFTYTLGKKVRPVIVLSSSMHNKLRGARILIAPLSSNPSNTALHQFSVNSGDTLYGQVLKQKSNILFDYSMMVSSSYLKPTNDAVNKATLEATLVWWRWRINSILSTD